MSASISFLVFGVTSQILLPFGICASCMNFLFLHRDLVTKVSNSSGTVIYTTKLRKNIVIVFFQRPKG
jgi:hypothetical protein